MTDLPIGPKVDTTPARRPGPVVLQGRYGRLEKLAAHHGTSLWRAVQGHDHIWTYMSAYGPFADQQAFADWIASRVTLEDPYSYAIMNTSGDAVGITTLMDIRTAARSVAVGHIV
jgi:hypothetical protein